MELLTNMIINTYPDAVIKDISDLVYRVQNPEKCMRLSTFSWFWEAGGRAAAGRSIIRNA